MGRKILLDLGPLCRALGRQRSRFILIALEIALTLAIATNCVNLLMDLRRVMLRPSGLDEANQISVAVRPFSEDLRDEAAGRQSRLLDLERLRQIPGVKAAIILNSIPLSGGGSSTGRRPAGTEITPVQAPYFDVTSQAVQAFGVEISAGRDFVPEDFLAEGGTKNILISESLGRKLFPEGNIVGQKIQSRVGSDVQTIVGVISTMSSSWPDSDLYGDAMLVPTQDPGYREFSNFLVRTEPGRRDEVAALVDRALLERHQGRLVEVQTMAEVRGDTFRNSVGLIRLLSAVVILLVLVTALGIAGLTSFSVTQRIKQIGTRRALGATRLDILRYFLVENWIVTTAGLIVGVAASLGLNSALLSWADAPRLSFALIAGGMLLLWMVGLGAAFAPARRAMMLPPVIATRSV
jgi:putative ABC transport system permease protein